MKAISVCKNVIAANNKRGWKRPSPAIRLSRTKAGRAVAYGHEVEILDREGNAVARIVTTQDGKPVIKCGAKVAILTKYDARIVR